MPSVGADQLLDVVGQTTPDGVHADFNHAVQPKLAQAILPLTQALGNTLLVDLLRLFGFHFGPEGADHRGPFHTHHLPRAHRLLRATLGFEGAGRTFRRRGPV